MGASLCSILGGSESIRDFIAFPKNNSGRDVMLDAPSTIDDKQLTELSIQLNAGGGQNVGGGQNIGDGQNIGRGQNVGRENI